MADLARDGTASRPVLTGEGEKKGRILWVGPAKSHLFERRGYELLCGLEQCFNIRIPPDMGAKSCTTTWGTIPEVGHKRDHMNRAKFLITTHKGYRERIGALIDRVRSENNGEYAAFEALARPMDKHPAAAVPRDATSGVYRGIRGGRTAAEGER